MANTVQVKRSGTASAAPTSLAFGELALNYADNKVFWKNASNTISSFTFQAYATAASPAITGNVTIDTSSGVPLTITNTGTGASFRVNDEASDTTPFIIDASGNVGIGVASPGYSLHVTSGSAQFPSAVFVAPTTHATSRRACVQIDDWLVLQDTGGNGTKNFGLYQGAGNAFRFTVDTSGNLGIGTTVPTALLDVNSNTLRLRSARTPASATAAGNAGDICWDASYLYICTATNTWRRIAHATW